MEIPITGFGATFATASSLHTLTFAPADLPQIGTRVGGFYEVRPSDLGRRSIRRKEGETV